jgi:hypothetical protein
VGLVVREQRPGRLIAPEPVKQATVRFYIDADLLGLAKILADLRPDVTYPGDPGTVVRKQQRPACPVMPNEQDTVWIPKVSHAGWLMITRDSAIQRWPLEIAAVLHNGGRMVALAGRDAVSKWDQLEIVMTQWRRIEKLHGLPGPFVYTATRTSLRKVA